jgi:hypothetical protein
MDHGEPAEGLRALAWITVEGNNRVLTEAIASVRAVTNGLIPAEQLPPTLDEHAVATNDGEVVVVARGAADSRKRPNKDRFGSDKGVVLMINHRDRCSSSH